MDAILFVLLQLFGNDLREITSKYEVEEINNSCTIKQKNKRFSVIKRLVPNCITLTLSVAMHQHGFIS